MEKKITGIESRSLQTILLPGCRFPVRRRRDLRLSDLLKNHQPAIDAAAATAVIGLMSLAGVWLFLTELAALVGNG